MSRITKCSLGDALNLKRGYDLPDRERVDGIYPVISSSGKTGCHNKFMVAGPGVVTGRYGTIGEVFYVKENFWPLNTSLYVEDFKGNDMRYIAYLLELYLDANQNAAGAVPGVNRNHLHKIKIQLHNKEDQKKIKNIISAYDDLIETNKQRIATLERMAEELYKEWFVRLRFPNYKKVTIEKGVPEGWSIKVIGDLVDFLSGYSFKSETYIPYGEYGIVTIKNVQDGHFVTECTDYINDTPSNMKTHCHLQRGDFLMSLTGNVGRVCRVYGEKYLLNQRVAKLKSKIPSSNQFIYYTFKNDSMVQLVENLSLGSTAQMNLSPIQLSKQKILVPTETLLKNYEDVCEPIQNKVLVLLEVNEILVKARDQLLSRLMSGKIDVEKLDIKFPPSMLEEEVNNA